MIHASLNAPAVDVAVTGGPVLIHDLAFGKASAYAKVEAGTYNLEVRPAGTMKAVLKLSNVRLNSRTVYSVFAEGLVGGQPALQAVVSVDKTASM